MNESLTLTGVVILILGIVFLFIPFVCLAGVPLAIAGFVILLVGAVSEGAPRAVYVYPYATGAPAAPPACPRCGQPLTFVPQYGRWYCPAEQFYPWG